MNRTGLVTGALAAWMIGTAPAATAQQDQGPFPTLGGGEGTFRDPNYSAPQQAATSADVLTPGISAAQISGTRLAPEPCTIKPVMTDEELKRCGARPVNYAPRKQSGS